MSALLFICLPLLHSRLINLKWQVALFLIWVVLFLLDMLVERYGFGLCTRVKKCNEADYFGTGANFDNELHLLYSG